MKVALPAVNRAFSAVVSPGSGSPNCVRRRSSSEAASGCPAHARWERRATTASLLVSVISLLRRCATEVTLSPARQCRVRQPDDATCGRTAHFVVGGCAMLPDAASVPEDVLAVLRGLRGAAKRAWLAGGAVRDLARGVPAQDFDVATDARPEEVVRLFPRTVPTGIQHGTVTVLSGDHKIEVTTFRGEGPYLDGRRPSWVTFLGQIAG